MPRITLQPPPLLLLWTTVLKLLCSKGVRNNWDSKELRRSTMRVKLPVTKLFITRRPGAATGRHPGKTGMGDVLGNVYDVSAFVRHHPGGRDKILLAAGSDVEAFWNQWASHY